MRRNLKDLLFKVAVLITCTGTATSYAFSPQDTQVLTQMYAQLKEQLAVLKDELEEIKAVNDEVFQAREYLQAVRGEYEFATRFNPEQELASFIGWSDGMTNLNDLDDTGWRQNWHLLSGEIDKRFERSSADEELKDLNRETSLRDFGEIQQTRYLQQFYREQAFSNQSDSAKDLQRRTASSTAMMSSLMLEQRAERLEAEAVRRQQLMNQLEWDHEFMLFLEGGE